MSKICTHINENTCKRCKPRPEKCWQLVSEVSVNDDIQYHLTEFYTGKTKKIPKKYFPQIIKLVRDKSEYYARAGECETSLQEIIEKVVNKGRIK